MKQIKTKISFLLISFAIMSAFFASCGGDDSTTGTTSGGWPPAFNFKTGQTFVYNNDSIANPNGVQQIIHTAKLSTDIVQAQTTIGGQLCYPFLGSTVDTIIGPPSTVPDVYNVYYDPTGRYYHYGIRQLINPSQPATWDLIGDFSVARGTSYTIGTISYSVPLPPPYNNILFSGPLSGVIKNEDSTTILTKSGETIYCYKIEMSANISGSYNSLPVTATIFLDYYVGYTTSQFPTNPAGLVRLNLKPFTFSVSGIAVPALSEPGYDRYLKSHNP